MLLPAVFLSLLVQISNVFAAVLTTSIYFPFVHHNTSPASANGEIAFIASGNGITTYRFNDPHQPTVTATLIQGPNVVIIIATSNPSFVASFSCNLQVTQALCFGVDTNPQNGQIIGHTTTITDSPLDSVALLLAGFPTPAAPLPGPASPTHAAPTSSPQGGGGGGGGGGGNGGGGGGNASPPSPTNQAPSQPSQSSSPPQTNNGGGNSPPPSSKPSDNTMDPTPPTPSPSSSSSSPSPPTSPRTSGEGVPLDSNGNSGDGMQGLLPGPISNSGDRLNDSHSSLRVFGAVLTAAASPSFSSTTLVYFPFNHGNNRDPVNNGVLLYLGQTNGFTSFRFTEPQNPSLTGTLVEGDDIVILLALVNPTFQVSYSCDVQPQSTQAVCFLVNIDPVDSLTASGISTDTLDSLALFVVGVPNSPSTPAPTPAPAPVSTSPPRSATSSLPSPPSSIQGNQNGNSGGNLPSPSPVDPVSIPPSQTSGTSSSNTMTSSNVESSSSSSTSKNAPTTHDNSSNGDTGISFDGNTDGISDQGITTHESSSSPKTAPNTFGAVLTTEGLFYFPLAHNTLPATENGQLSIVGESDGITTYLFNEPQTPLLTATLIEGQNVAVIIASANPTFVASYSCDIQGSRAVCLGANFNPQNGDIIQTTVTDIVDSLALVEIGLPATLTAPTTPSPSSQSPSQTVSPPQSSTPPTDDGNSGNDSPPPATPPTGVASPSQTTDGNTASSPSSLSASPNTSPTDGTQPGSAAPTASAGDQGIIPGPISPALSETSSSLTSATISFDISILLIGISACISLFKR